MPQNTDSTVKLTPHGFKWRPVEVERTALVNGYVILRVITSDGIVQELQISPAGRKIEVRPQFKLRT